MLIVIRSIGGLLLLAALAIYVVAALAMDSYELRRRLPYNSPFELWGRGCFCFYVGAALIIVSAALSR